MSLTLKRTKRAPEIVITDTLTGRVIRLRLNTFQANSAKVEITADKSFTIRRPDVTKPMD